MTYVGLTPGLLALGVINGMTYGILAVGLVLVYRTSRVINFAHGEIGAVGAAFCGLCVTKWHVNYWLALAFALLLSAGLGAATEGIVVRRLRAAPKVMSLVATLGVATFLLSMSAVINNQASAGAAFPLPAGMPQFHIGVLLVTKAYSAMLIFSPLVVLGLVLFLKRSRFGLALLASAANPERARLAGVSTQRMSTLAWAIAGAIAAFTVVLIIPTQGFITADVFGPSLLLRALVPAVVARMQSLPVALVTGIGVGILDQALIYHYPTSGISELILLGVILVALLAQQPRSSRKTEREDWSLLQPWGPLPEALEKVWLIRNLGRVVASAGMAVGVLVALLGSNTTAVTMVSVVAFSLIGLSIGVLTGLGGQVSLGQFAIAGVGATASYLVTFHTGNYLLGLLVAAIAGSLVSLVLGLPALRVRGLLLAVITLSFALASERWLLAQSWALGNGVAPGRPILGSFSLYLTKRYFGYALVVFGVSLWLTRNIWSGGIGLRLRAARDNEDATRAFAMSTTRIKLQGFLVAGALAGVGGALYGHLLSNISAAGFDVITSLNVVALAVLGGVGVLWGPLLGALYIVALPSLVPLDSAELAATSLGWLLLIVFFPGGIAQAVAVPRERIIHALARWHGLDPLQLKESTAVPALAISRPQFLSAAVDSAPASESAGDILRVEHLVKRFGGVTALDDVSFSVAAGEVLGIIGPNGAGKTTLFEVVGGFTPADVGRVWFGGTNVSSLSPDRRAGLGLMRSFQDPTLFPTLTVIETVMLAFERDQPTKFAASGLGWQRPERRKLEKAREIVALMGLHDYRHKQIRELSTGTRRITELACILALRPKVLLLDEPSSGIAQRESEALGGVLLGLRAYLDATLIVIEHDIPLLMSMSNRVIAMDSGRIIATGSPEEVRSEPEVVRSYLGGDITTIERSGSTTASRAATGSASTIARCGATTRAGQACRRPAGADGACASHSAASAAHR